MGKKAATLPRSCVFFHTSICLRPQTNATATVESGEVGGGWWSWRPMRRGAGPAPLHTKVKRWGEGGKRGKEGEGARTLVVHLSLILMMSDAAGADSGERGRAGGR